MYTVHIPSDFPEITVKAMRMHLCRQGICTTQCHPDSFSFDMKKNSPDALVYLEQFHAQGVEVLPTAPPRHYVRVSAKDSSTIIAPHAAPRSFNASELVSLYNVAPRYPNTRYNIAIIELGGGYQQSDLTASWKSNGLTIVPTVNAISINGAQNRPGIDINSDYEVALDIQVIGGVCPNSTMDVYFAPNDAAAQGFMNAVSTAVKKNKTNSNTPYYSAISISWGAPEDAWPRSVITRFESIFQQASQRGIGVFAAAGDSGATDGESGLHVDYPASSPYVVGCGGTALTASGKTYVSETAWKGSGGGFSALFPRPPYQSSVNSINKRSVPDIAGVADPATGINVIVGRKQVVIGGTSAVSPLWSAVYCNAGAPGNFPAALYSTPQQNFHDIVSGCNGDNGNYCARPGFDQVTGWGTPKGLPVFSQSPTPPAPRR